jgi:hypothetical protein
LNLGTFLLFTRIKNILNGKRFKDVGRIKLNSKQNLSRSSKPNMRGACSTVRAIGIRVTKQKGLLEGA